MIYYQFDYDQFRKGQYQEGYFDYKNNPFGKSLQDKCEVFNEIENIIQNNFCVGKNYLTEHSIYFPLFDADNCKRVYEVVAEL